MKSGGAAHWICVLLLLASSPAARADPANAGGRPPRSMALSKGWLFQPDPLGLGDAQHWQRPDFDRRGWRAVNVPMAWDAYDAAMDGYEGVCWYALTVPADAI